jgi:hypothetical protein
MRKELTRDLDEKSLRHKGFGAVPSRNVFPTIRKRKTTKKKEKKNRESRRTAQAPEVTH